MVGLRYAQLLDRHPWFRVTFLAGSERTRGQTYQQATGGEAPASLAALPIHGLDALQPALERCELVFSCIGDRETAHSAEEKYATAGLAVVSNTAAHRGCPTVPVVIPEINASHLDVLPQQKWKAPLIAKPNCSLQSYLLPLATIHKSHRLKHAIITTMQAVSGAGRTGVGSVAILDNLIPFISREEEKNQTEPLKILGTVTKEGIRPASDIELSAHCNRISVLDGHIACVSVAFESNPSEEEILAAWSQCEGLALPSAPKRPILYRPEPDRPQPRLDRDASGGMSVTCGRLRPCPVLQWRFVGLSHNMIRGAAGGGILNAELLVTSHHWYGTQPPSR
jgi:aspartate-semialdehyde dehydrogenase